MNHQKSKSQPITKQMVWFAWLQVKENDGSGGIDNQSIASYEANLANNLYKLWNRMTSGSYFPSSIKRIYIPKEGGKRPLGLPTIEDKIAQTVVTNYLEPLLEKHFHQDSYGFRPNKSAHQALSTLRERCHKMDWVVDIDIEKFFEEVDHDLLMKAVEKHTSQKWVLMYIKRWLKAPIQDKEVTIFPEKGLAQGAVISPLLANLYLHYTLDK